MNLIIGLGNPGKKYIKTRHNAGFMAVEEIKNHYQFEDWKFNKKFNAEISKGEINTPAQGCSASGGKTLLVMPQTFMNNSGESVRIITDFYKINPKNILIIHDDMDISLGEFKIQENKSSGGHKGVQSIIEKLGTKNFKRIRIGINPTIKDGISELKIPTEKFVLEKFKTEEIKMVKKNIKEIIFEMTQN